MHWYKYSECDILNVSGARGNLCTACNNISTVQTIFQCSQFTRESEVAPKWFFFFFWGSSCFSFVCGVWYFKAMIFFGSSKHSCNISNQYIDILHVKDQSRPRPGSLSPVTHQLVWSLGWVLSSPSEGQCTEDTDSVLQLQGYAACVENTVCVRDTEWRIIVTYRNPS